MTDKGEIYLTSIHVKPIYYYPKNDVNRQKILKKGKSTQLISGDTFSLLQSAYKFKVVIDEGEAAPSSPNKSESESTENTDKSPNFLVNQPLFQPCSINVTSSLTYAKISDDKLILERLYSRAMLEMNHSKMDPESSSCAKVQWSGGTKYLKSLTGKALKHGYTFFDIFNCFLYHYHEVVYSPPQPHQNESECDHELLHCCKSVYNEFSKLIPESPKVYLPYYYGFVLDYLPKAFHTNDKVRERAGRFHFLFCDECNQFNKFVTNCIALEINNHSLSNC